MRDGIININKAKNFTSHDVVYKIKKMLGKRVGHTGTLDPIATGVLPICIGKATKISQYILSQTKRYTATVLMGTTTDTLDITGKILSQKNFIYNHNEILSTLNKFRGEYYQIPPMFSAIKKNGKKLYELARDGINIEREKRLVNIFKLDFVNFVFPNKIVIDVKCSKGTYIRSLCDDIGNAIGCGACLFDLIRTECGQFSIDKSITLDEFESLVDKNLADEKIIKIENALEFKKIFIDDCANKFLYNGNKIDLKFVIGNKKIFADEKLLVFDCQKNLVGIYIRQDNFLKPLRMLLGDFDANSK